MIKELEFNRAFAIVKNYKSQENDAYYEAMIGLKKKQTCAVWARGHPNMSKRLRSVLMYNVANKKISEINDKTRKSIRGLGLKSWLEFCYLTNKNFI